MINNKKNLLRIISLSGLIGVIAYTAHVIIGGLLWREYNHITQTISELTQNGAPNAELLRILTLIYGIFAVVFSFCLYYIFKIYKVDKVAKIGAILLIIMEITSLIGYALFPIDNMTEMNFQNIMHIAVTAIVVICTVGSVFCIGIGLMKTPSYKGIGVFVLICAVIITLSGISTPIVMANQIMVSGLTERINIFTLQTCIAVLSVYFFVGKNNI